MCAQSLRRSSWEGIVSVEYATAVGESEVLAFRLHCVTCMIGRLVDCVRFVVPASTELIPHLTLKIEEVC